MEFRPCIDIHNGKVKQIVGGSLVDGAGTVSKENTETDNIMFDGAGIACKEQAESETARSGSTAKENFVSSYDAAFYAKFYKQHGIFGGHVILLNKTGTEEYEATKKEALSALNTFPGGLQVGGGICPANAKVFLDAGAQAVIVTSYVFANGMIHMGRLQEMVNTVGKERLVLDLSVRRRDGQFYIVTDRWQKYTDTILDKKLLEHMEKYAVEYLIHAVDVEGKASGIDEELAEILGSYQGIPITYAGGIHSFEDLEILKTLGKNHVNATIGSALDLFGGNMAFEDVLGFCRDC